MLTQQDITAVDQRIQAYMASGQFNLNRIPFHTHNGKDAPFIYIPTLPYAGRIQGNGTISRTKPYPSGWGLVYPAFGTYIIQHNLGSTFYCAQATQVIVAANPLPAFSTIISETADQLAVAYFYPGTFAATGSISGTSATLTGNWTGVTGSYTGLFSNGDTRTISLTNGATTMTWAGALSSTATVNFFVSIDVTFDFTLVHVSNTKPGWPLYNKNAT